MRLVGRIRKRVYHASSLSLPLSITENKYNIDKLENELRSLQNKQQYFLLNKSSQKIVDEVNSINKKSIETITIYTAIISFIVGSIGVYKFIESFEQALLFVVVFGVSISIFVLLIFINTKGLKKLSEYKIWISLIYLVALLLIKILGWRVETKHFKLNINTKDKQTEKSNFLQVNQTFEQTQRVDSLRE